MTDFIVVTTPGVRGPAGSDGIPAPVWAIPNNTIPAINSIVPENVAEEREVAAGQLEPDNVVEGVIQIHIPDDSTNGAKFFRVCLDVDDSESFIEEFAAAQVGTVEIRVRLLLNQVSPHLLNVMYLYNEAVWNQGRGEVDADVVGVPVKLQLRAWVENALDSIKVDSVYWHLIGSGRA